MRHDWRKSGWLRGAGLALSWLAWGACAAPPTVVTDESAPNASASASTATTAPVVVEPVEPEPVAEPAPEPVASVRPGAPLERTGDEIVVAGQRFHTGTPVVLWSDPGGYDGYRVERRFAPWAQADWEKSQAANPRLTSPNRYGLRAATLTPAQIEQVRGGGWELSLLQQVVDQFVLHYDASGTSRSCFERLHDERGLSIHFMLDVDGTIYQTLDLKERAWHATIANSRSVGIEIANIGAYADPEAKALTTWYRRDEAGAVRLTIPPEAHPDSFRNPAAELRPDRPEMIAGPIHGEVFHQYDLTPAQYAALAKLTAALCTIFPRLACDYPRDAAGALVTELLAEEAWRNFGGVIGHYHIQRNKIDPGPALQWERLIGEARALMAPAPDSPPPPNPPAGPGETPASP